MTPLPDGTPTSAETLAKVYREHGPIFTAAEVGPSGFVTGVRRATSESHIGSTPSDLIAPLFPKRKPLTWGAL